MPGLTQTFLNGIGSVFNLIPQRSAEQVGDGLDDDSAVTWATRDGKRADATPPAHRRLENSGALRQPSPLMADKSKKHRKRRRPAPPANRVGRPVELPGQLLDERLPSPAVLGQYEAQLPGAAIELLRLFKAEANRRHAIRRKIIEAQIARQNAEGREMLRGQIFGLVIGIVALGCGTSIALHSPTVFGIVCATLIGGGGVIGLVSVFIVGRRLAQKVNHAPPRYRPARPITGKIGKLNMTINRKSGIP